MITRDLLRSLRNDLPMSYTIQQLGDKAPSSKYAEGRFRFICHHCGELLASVNPRNNLAHCFCCGKNINNIDLLLHIGYGFREAVETLQKWLLLYNREKIGPKNASRPAGCIQKRENNPELLGSIIRHEFENHGPGG